MKSNKNLHLNRSNRKVQHNYSDPGIYYITANTQDGKKILGNIENRKMHLSKYGEIVKNEIFKIPKYHKRIVLDEWVIMPNHIHMIIILRDYDFDNGISDIGANVGQNHDFDLHDCTTEKYRLYRRNMLIPKIMGKFQMQTSKQFNILCNTPGQKNWQNDYYDVIINTQNDNLKVKQYIINNPKEWSL
ncbi:MAG: hypothetical protein JXR36_00815 [Bacteroidales bacterium]|nr:hypothetical protein [Bacteroidales bacterium]